MALYDDPKHRIDIYLPAAPTVDDGGGIKLAWSASPDQEDVKCSINTTGGSEVLRQQRKGNTTRSVVGIKTELLDVTLVVGAKFLTVGDHDPGRILIFTGFSSPNREAPMIGSAIPPLTYCNVEEYR